MKLDDVIDERKLSELRDLGDGNDDFLLDLLARYTQKSREQLAEAREALAQGNRELLTDIIHSWKGATTALGLNELNRELTRFNEDLRKGRSPDAEAVLEKLAGALTRLENLQSARDRHHS